MEKFTAYANVSAEADVIIGRSELFKRLIISAVEKMTDDELSSVFGLRVFDPKTPAEQTPLFPEEADYLLRHGLLKFMVTFNE